MLRLRRHKTVNDPVAVVNRFVDAANRHDADGIARCLHPDFESIQPVYPSRNFRGSDQVKRNWQAIFQSEPGFRLTLVRASANEGTVWVELHGAGSDVEVAGVFIMGVEENLVRWARVYSAVIEQPAVEMAPPAEGPGLRVVAPSPQAEAEELRRVIEAGRETAGDGAADGVAGSGEGAAAGSVTDDDARETASEETGDAVPATEAVADEGLADEGPASAEAAEDDEAEAVTALEGATSAEATAGGEPSDTHADEAVAAQSDPSTDRADGDPPEPAAAGVADEQGEGEAPGSAAVAAEATPSDDDPSPEKADQGGISPELSAVVAEVQALAEPMRPGRPGSRQRKQGKPSSAEDAGNAERSDNVVELDDAARVRAAARAATTKAAALTGAEEPDGGPSSSGGDGTPRKRSRQRRPPRKT